MTFSGWLKSHRVKWFDEAGNKVKSLVGRAITDVLPRDLNENGILVTAPIETQP